VLEFVNFLIAKLAAMPAGQRYILGVTGAPGSGKSTVAEWITSQVNARVAGAPAVIVPMDGYHYADERLRQMGLWELKGIPDTFDAAGFIDLLRRLREITDKNVYCPLFDRTIEASIDDAIVIEPAHRLCVVEGNYLLMQKSPWDQCRQYFDEVWFLDVPIEILLPRLRERHVRGGRSPDGAMAKVECTDLPNARLVDETKSYADRLITLEEMPVPTGASS
jgi:pantothenate kinase